MATIDPLVLGHLKDRIGLFALRQRWSFEQQGEDETRDLLHRLPLKQVLPRLLALTGLAERGRRNAVDLEVNHNLLPVLAAGSGLAGFRILQLSDLHIENFPELLGAVIRAVSSIDCDLCVLTGDFAFTHNAVGDVIDAVSTLHEAITAPTYAILGNHDSIAIVPPLEAQGIRFLINESVELRHGSETFTLAGVDDTIHYRASDLERALAGRASDLTVLLNHSPTEYRQAAFAGVDVYLTGHTHGGQICLPGRIPLMSNSSAPRRLVAGRWRYRNMAGYTSRGVGSSMVRVRFNCRPEIVVHELAVR